VVCLDGCDPASEVAGSKLTALPITRVEIGMRLYALLVSYARERGVSRAAFRHAMRRLVGVLGERPVIPWKTKPVSRVFGLDRGTPIDRYYIEQFLEANKKAVQGGVLEFGDDEYFRKLAAPESSVSILHASHGNPAATIVGDLGSRAFLEERQFSFNCIICTQVLQCIFPVQQAVENLYAMLRPGGVLLVSVPGISQISRYDMDRWGDYWRFTSLSLRKLFELTCPSAILEIHTHGNVLAAVGFLHGLSAEEVGFARLDRHDPDYELTLCVWCRKPG
jgi:SAM-dependent methyltransferase